MPRNQPPDTQLLLQWGRELNGVIRLLERLPKQPLPYGKSERWRVGMQSYYHRKARELLDNAPQGAEQEAKSYKLRLSKV